MFANTVERRIYKRREIRTKVVFDDEFGEGLFYVYSKNISMGGIFLASDIPLKIGTLLFLSFELPLHKRFVKITGEVVRKVDPDNAGAKGMGVRFVGLSELAVKRLKGFLRE